jgi:glucose-1-phosphatase
MPPTFFYFDMGNVLLRFSHERMATQMAGVVGIESRRAWQILFEDGLHWAYERGQFDADEFYGRFCAAAGASPPDIAALDAAGNDIFELNAPIVGLVGKLVAAGHRLGVCSNTTASHWIHCASRYSFLTTMFPTHALSYRVLAMKPDPRFYAAATDLTGAGPRDIFFTDDRAENVTAATKAGWDAVRFESVSQLNEALRCRSCLINY